MEKSRSKYDDSFKTKVITEFFQGASAKELSSKYGVKERTIYSWSKSARENNTVVPREGVTNDDIRKQMESLEERVIKMEKVLNNQK